VHCIQNHDQVGNRAFGERLNHDIETAAFRAASALLLLTPFTPLLWMGQEWAATSPFLYFTDHPPELGRLVTEGRRKEFGHFSAFSDPAARARIPDPQAEETFNRSKLRWGERDAETHRGILRLYRELLALRREHPALRTAERGCFEVAPLGENALALRRSAAGTGDLLIVASFEGPTRLDLGSLQETRPPASAAWRLLLSTEEKAFGAADNGAVRLSGTDELEINGPATAVLESGTKTL
jgi:maltooligosyltrehalose trehalohydrolase